MTATATLLDERPAIRRDGHHVTRYVPDFSAISLRLREDRSLALEIERDAPGAVNEPPSP